jgi:hypothetical protein
MLSDCIDRWQRLASMALVVVGVSACTGANSSFCADDDDCMDGTVCDEDGSLAGIEGDCVPAPVPCAPGAVLRCADRENEVVCGDDGQSEEIRDCAGFGCNDVRGICNQCEPNTVRCGPHTTEVEEYVDCNAEGTIEASRECLLGCSTERTGCVDIDPSNGLSVDLDFMDANGGRVRDVELRNGFTVNSDTGEILDDGNPIETVNSRPQFQIEALGILVFRVRRLSIEGEIAVLGDRAVAFVSDGDIEINGLVDVTAGDITEGDICVGKPPSVSGDGASGGGGAGFGQNGGNGGDAPDLIGGGGGSGTGDAGLEPLRGGCRGGIEPPGGLLSGGSGGGALQLVARQRILFGPSGRITVAGKGGGYEGMLNPGAASGGGSGGGVLLEAPEVAFASGSFVSANGGGGGCQGAVGERGLLARQPAAGADCGSADSVGNGGDGGSATSNSRDGADVLVSSGYAGGGGGGVGRIRINRAPGGGTPDSMFFSPDPDVGDVGTR